MPTLLEKYKVPHFDAREDGKKIFIAGEHVSGEKMAASLSRATGREFIYNNVDPDVYRSCGFPGADEMGKMFQFKRDFESIIAVSATWILPVR